MSLFTTGLAELVLIVEDVPRAAKFYREVVGLAPEDRSDDEWAWFFAGDSEQAQRIALHKGSLLFEEHSPHPPGHRFGNVHLSHSRCHASGSTRRSNTCGVAVTAVYGPTRFDWMNATSYYFYDSDGNLLEFWSPDNS